MWHISNTGLLRYVFLWAFPHFCVEISTQSQKGRINTAHQITNTTITYNMLLAWITAVYAFERTSKRKSSRFKSQSRWNPTHVTELLFFLFALLAVQMRQNGFLKKMLLKVPCSCTLAFINYRFKLL